MMRLVKRLFCRHEWKRAPDAMIKEGHYIRMRARFRCAKCGKVVIR